MCLFGGAFSPLNIFQLHFNATYDLFEVIYDLKQPKNSTNLEQKLIEISSPERWPILFLLLHLRHRWVEGGKIYGCLNIFEASTQGWRKWRSKNKMGHLSGELISISFCSKYIQVFFSIAVYQIEY